jgi:subtilisin-like proprotein convertase family protein
LNPLTDIVVVASGGGGHTLAINGAGELFAWGHNKAGQVGVNSDDTAISWAQRPCIPTTIDEAAECVPVEGIVNVDAWSGHSLALRADGTLWDWGSSNDGETAMLPTNDLCPNGDPCVQYPQQVCLDTECSEYLTGIVTIEALRGASVAVDEDGQTWFWGGGLNEANGTPEPLDRPVPVCIQPGVDGCDEALGDIVGVAGGNYTAYALDRNGQLWSWGNNRGGLLGTERFWNSGSTSAQPVVELGDGAVASRTSGGPCRLENTRDATDVDFTGVAWSYDLSGMCVNLIDGGYDGTLESMQCFTVRAFDDRTVPGLTLELGLVHERIGDLVVKLVTPAGDVVAMMSRPGLDEAVDDGSECCGAEGTITRTSTIRLDQTSSTSIEEASALAGESVCVDASTCSYRADGGAAEGTVLFGDLTSVAIAGNWTVCIGDAGEGSTGSVYRTRLREVWPP